MRILFLLLILLNLGYFMWQWPQHTNDKILPSGPLPVTPNSKVLKMLSERSNPPAIKPAPKRDASPAPSDDAAPQAPAAGKP